MIAQNGRQKYCEQRSFSDVIGWDFLQLPRIAKRLYRAVSSGVERHSDDRNGRVPSIGPAHPEGTLDWKLRNIYESG